MNAIVQEWIVGNDAWTGAQPRLSVLIPFLNDDPTRLMAALDQEAARVGAADGARTMLAPAAAAR